MLPRTRRRRTLLVALALAVAAALGGAPAFASAPSESSSPVVSPGPAPGSAGNQVVLVGRVVVPRGQSVGEVVVFSGRVVVEGIVRANFSDLVPWFLTGNIAAAFGWETVRSEGHSIGPEAGLLRLLLYLVLIGAGSIAVFRSRDVT